MCDCLCTCEKERERKREREIQLDFHQSRLVERRVCLRQINYSRPRNDVNTKYKSNKPMERLVLCHRYYDKRQGNSETQYLSAIRTAGCKGSNGHWNTFIKWLPVGKWSQQSVTVRQINIYIQNLTFPLAPSPITTIFSCLSWLSSSESDMTPYYLPTIEDRCLKRKHFKKT